MRHVAERLVPPDMKRAALSPTWATRSFCYVDDLIEAVIRTMDTPDNFTGPINIGNPREFTMLDSAEAARSASSRYPRTTRNSQPDIGLAGSVLDWSPKVELKAGLAETIGYFRTQLDSEKKGTSGSN
jgi:UDP-glucuronate decarboxylase